MPSLAICTPALPVLYFANSVLLAGLVLVVLLAWNDEVAVLVQMRYRMTACPVDP